jgi:alkanesulfonate monooxygenase SsuD/methylene tetrahydromethanopterin reductase-like flavin-dependent oxidoreductase (luciferase family)
MEIGIALPTMARGFTRETLIAWCAGIDTGPFSSVSTGDRVSFHNPELITTTAGAAALTSRVRVMTNVAVLPLHSTAVVAKQLATLDVLSGGRLTVGVGVGGREHDYRAAGVSFAGRHRRLDQAVGDLRRLWAGEAPFEGADPIGPAPVQPGGPPILAGALGPRSMRRAAAWADGVTGFTIAAEAAEIRRTNALATEAWHEAGRSSAPRLVNGTFYVLGGADPQSALSSFTRDYLLVFGAEVARALAASVEVSTPQRLRRVVEETDAAGCDELILVPGTLDPACLEATVAALAG